MDHHHHHHDRDDDRLSRSSVQGHPNKHNMLKPDEDRSFFDRERDKLAGEITAVRVCFHFHHPLPSSLQRAISVDDGLFLCTLAQGFEELLSSSNILNRKFEEVLGMTREYDTIAALWGSFHELMKGQKNAVSLEEQPLGLPGTGGHVVSSKGDGGGK